MADFTLALEGASDEGFTTDVVDGTFVVLGATPIPVFSEGPQEKWGGTAANSTEYVWHVQAVLDLVGIDGFGTIVDLVAICASRYMRVMAEDTVLPRLLTPGGANFWTDETVGWVRSNRPVCRQALDLAPDFGAGGDNVTLRLRDVDPNT